MSDEKREKLRECLRNNNSNNKENSNKNLENYLNLDKNLNSKKDENLYNSNLKNNIDDNLKSDENLNLKNNLSSSKDNLNNQSNLQNNTSQNFKSSSKDLNCNKNSNSSNSINKRDYDKEPLVIKDFRKEILFYCFIPAIFYVILNKILFDKGIITFRVISVSHDTYSSDFGYITTIIFIIIVALYVKKNIAKNDIEFKFFDSKIALNKVDFIDTNLLKDTDFIIDNRTKLFPILLIVLYFLFLIDLDMAHTIGGIIMLIYCPFILLSIVRNKSIKNCFSLGFLIIKNRYGNVYIPIFSKKNKDNLRNYFLEVLGIDIEKKINYLMIKTF